MRLSKREIEVVREVLTSVDPKGKIYIFGSRADDNRKGGDIDLYFEPSKEIDYKTSLTLEYRISSLCDTKVDLLIKNPEQKNKAIFEIARQGIPL